MARQLDPLLKQVLEANGEDPRDTRNVVWDCHGTWVVYHKALERVAARAGIVFDPPLVLEANGAGKCAALCVSARLGDRTDWSIGEAAPGNNKNSYPFAMAEKRARDRVILKLIGLAGLAYSEEEADEFKGEPPRPTAEVKVNGHSVARASDTVDLHEIVAYTAKAKTIIANLSEAELREWWRSDAPRRRELGIVKGTSAFDELAALCEEKVAA